MIQRKYNVSFNASCFCMIQRKPIYLFITLPFCDPSTIIMAAPRYPLLEVDDVTLDAKLDPQVAPRAVNIGKDGQPPVLAACAPMMRPGAITRLFRDAGRRVMLSAPVFIDCFLPVHLRQNTNYIAVVASLCVPTTTGGRGERSAAIAVQACATGYSIEDTVTPREAKQIVGRGLKDAWNDMPADVRNPLVVEGVAPAWTTTDAQVPDDHMAFLIEKLASVEAQKEMTVNIYATALLGFCKRGNVSNNVINQVTNAVQEELNLNIELDANTIRTFWNYVGGWFNPTQAEGFFRRWEATVRDSSLPFSLLIEQASWAGLYTYT